MEPAANTACILGVVKPLRATCPILFGLLAATQLISPNMETFVWQARLRALARVVHGAGEFLVFLIARLAGGPTPRIMFVGLVLLAVGLTLFLARVRRHSTVLWIALALNTAFGIAGVYAGGLLVQPAREECTRTVQGAAQVRVLSFHEIGFAPGDHFFLSASTDGGQTWYQVFAVGVRFPILEPCNRLQALDASFQWFWLGSALAVTQDGGSTWNVWQISDLWPDWVCCDARHISIVGFRDHQVGTMDLGGTDLPTSQLVTEDGGLSWHVP